MLKVSNPLDTCAILAGGLSGRMGRDKATLRLGEKSLVEGVYGLAKTLFKQVFVVSSCHSPMTTNIDAPIIGDLLPVKAPLVGIVSALLHAQTSHVFVLACDMPFVSEESIYAVIQSFEGEDIVLPKTAQGFEPLHALYSRSCICHMLNSIERGKLNIRNVFPYVCVKAVESRPAFFAHGRSVFLNINTESELQKARDLETKLNDDNEPAFVVAGGRFR
ncbi:MAG TPA: molybdenum cofactor guanylyltransferase [Syntrophorhabdaceae bacterium]|nr:molybdenum cofactor guanylyltransferase [Syntrophorhabdaceae bacterium]